jgi:hypothetical protein
MRRDGAVSILGEIGNVVVFRAKGSTHWDRENDENDTAH